jgi:primosomal protein N' (replication factor Y)
VVGIPELAPGVLRVAPATDPLPLILSAHQQLRDLPGSLLVLVPSESWAVRLRGRLEQRGLSVAGGEADWAKARAGWPIIVGARGAALSPAPLLRGAVVIDADDDAFRSEASPTWHAADVVRERCRRDDVPFWMTSVMPSPAVRDTGEVTEASTPALWPRVEVVDRRQRDPRDGALSAAALDAAHRALAGPEAVAVVVVLQRLGSGRLYACKRCGELARCGVCEGPEREFDGLFACEERHEPRENFCRACSATNLRAVRSGVTTLARDIGHLLSQPVTEVTSATKDAAMTRVVVGTEAVLSRVRRCGVVIFADFDQYLLAPRASARRDAVVAVAKAGRLVGPRNAPRGPVVVQTRRHDEVIDALVAGDVAGLEADDLATAEVLGLRPFAATATFSGEAADAFAEALRGVDPAVVLRATAEGYVLRCATTAQLCDLLAATPRPSGRLRVAVD